MLLRITASGLLVAVACNNLSRGDASVLSVSIMILAIFLALGLFTVAASSLAAVISMTLPFLLHQETLAASTVTVSVCVALALLGAGAYSVDARLFGQRRVVWPNH
ncbi:hypothetical protein [Terriglobus saanensis]|nr:hypothetical protein [Terriglobus saanensis]